MVVVEVVFVVVLVVVVLVVVVVVVVVMVVVDVVVVIVVCIGASSSILHSGVNVISSIAKKPSRPGPAIPSIIIFIFVFDLIKNAI